MHKYLFCFKGIQFFLKDFYAMDSLDYGTFFQAINEKTKIINWKTLPQNVVFDFMCYEKILVLFGNIW